MWVLVAGETSMAAARAAAWCGGAAATNLCRRAVCWANNEATSCSQGPPSSPSGPAPPATPLSGTTSVPVVVATCPSVAVLLATPPTEPGGVAIEWTQLRTTRPNYLKKLQNLSSTQYASILQVGLQGYCEYSFAFSNTSFVCGTTSPTARTITSHSVGASRSDSSVRTQLLCKSTHINDSIQWYTQNARVYWRYFPDDSGLFSLFASCTKSL